MRLAVLGLAAFLLGAPLSTGHEPPGPVTECQPSWGETLHDYLPPNLGFFVRFGDGNLSECPGSGSTQLPFVAPFCGVNMGYCDPETCTTVVNMADAYCYDGTCLVNYGWCAGGTCVVNDDACVGTCVINEGPCSWGCFSPANFGTCDGGMCFSPLNPCRAGYDGEFDHGHGGAILAVQTGDGLTWGSLICWGMLGHHTNRIYAQEWPRGSGPAFSVTSDFSRLTSTSPVSPDCGDGVIEPCSNEQPEPTTYPFPLNIVMEETESIVYEVLSLLPVVGGTCNLYDCWEHNSKELRTTYSNPVGPTHVVANCMPGADGTYWVWISPDFDAPNLPQMGHVWTTS